MNSKVHPLVVALVMILTFVAIGLWMWGRGEASIIGGPAELRMDQNGHLYIQIQDRLIEHDADGSYVETHDLSTLGVEQFFGTYDFFSNGDILLRRGPDPRSFFDNVRAFHRETNQSSLQPQTPASGLFRCSLKTRECRRFGENGIDFKATFGTFIDRAGDVVYISDTSRHLLRKYSADGASLSDPIDGFEFPNQILVHDGQLYVADTNNHRIRVIESRPGEFGRQIASYNTTPGQANRDEQRWPSHFARVGEEWWVNNMRFGMNEGGIYIFDNEWRFDRKASLPPNADPISLIEFRNEILVTDWNNDRVHRVSPTGELLGLFQSPGLERVFEESESARTEFEYISYSGVFLLALVIAGLFVRALVVTLSPDEHKDGADDVQESELTFDGPLRLAPNPKVVKRARFSIRVVAFLFTFATIMTVVMISGHDAGIAFARKLILPTSFMLAIVFLIAWVGRANTESSISIHGDVLTLKDSSGRESSCSLKDACYDNSTVATRDMAVFLGQPPAALYDRDALDEHLFPRLAEAKRLSVIRMQLLLITLRHPQGFVTVFAVAGLVIYGLDSLFEWGG